MFNTDFIIFSIDTVDRPASYTERKHIMDMLSSFDVRECIVKVDGIANKAFACRIPSEIVLLAIDWMSEKFGQEFYTIVREDKTVERVFEEDVTLLNGQFQEVSTAEANSLNDTVLDISAGKYYTVK